MRLHVINKLRIIAIIMAIMPMITSCATMSISSRIERAKQDLKTNLSANDTINGTVVARFEYCGVGKGYSGIKVYKSNGEDGTLYLHMTEMYGIVDCITIADYDDSIPTIDVVPPLTVYVCVKDTKSITLNDIRGPSPSMILAIRRKISPGSHEYNSNYDNDSRLRGNAIYIDDGVIRVLEIQQSTKVKESNVIMLNLLKISYFVTIPIDIITLPLQVLIVLTDSGAPATPFF